MTPDTTNLVPLALIIFFAIGLHEYAHCKFADMAGDPTPGINGRVTLNLFKHFDLYGTIMIFVTIISGIGIGWGKPAPMNPKRMRDPRWDFFIAVAAGPISNLVQAIIYGFIGRMMMMDGGYNRDSFIMAASGGSSDFLAVLVAKGILTNLGLAFFNLIPLGPLDGHWLLGLLLPERPRDKWYLFNRHYGWYALIAIVLIGQFTPISIIGSILRPIIVPLFYTILGV